MRGLIPIAMAIILGGGGVAAAQPAGGNGQGKASPDTQVFTWSGSFGKGRLGVQVQEITDELRQFFGAGAGAGVLVGRVVADTPAARAGIQVGDVIVAVAGKPVTSAMDVLTALSSKNKGDQVEVTIVRGKQQLTLKATMNDDAGRMDAFGNFDVIVPDVGLPDLKALRPLGDDPRMKERLERMEKQLRELERKLDALGKK